LIILPDNEMHRFQIKRLQKEIEGQLKEWRDEEVLKATYHTVLGAWSDLLHKGIDDSTLYRYKVELERKYYD